MIQVTKLLLPSHYLLESTEPYLFSKTNVIYKYKYNAMSAYYVSCTNLIPTFMFLSLNLGLFSFNFFTY